jgi:hypothetical protein
MKTDPMGESRAGQTPLSARIGTGSRLHRPIREALPFLLVLVFTLAAMGGINLALHERAPTPLQQFNQSLVLLIYLATWILLLFCTAAAVAQREIAMRRECNALAIMLSLNFVADLINVNARFLQGRIAGTILFMQVGLLLAAMLALFTFLYWVLDPPKPTMERQAFWWVPPPGNTILDSPWRPAFIDYLYLSTVVTFSFFPNVEPTKQRSKVLVMIHFLVAFDVDLILLARAVGLLPS